MSNLVSHLYIQARSETEFGNSWVVNGDQCDDVDPGPSDPCEDGDNTLTRSEDVCYVLKDPSGRRENVNLHDVNLIETVHVHLTDDKISTH